MCVHFYAHSNFLHLYKYAQSCHQWHIFKRRQAKAENNIKNLITVSWKTEKHNIFFLFITI